MTLFTYEMNDLVNLWTIERSRCGSGGISDEFFSEIARQLIFIFKDELIVVVDVLKGL